jgi:hypothetical protein
MFHAYTRANNNIQFRDACPPHKLKDLDALVKQFKGDEAKIQAKITEWWDEPQVEEPRWENVGKANKKTTPSSSFASHSGGGGGGGTMEKKDTRGDRGGGGDRNGGRNEHRDRAGVSGSGGSGPGRRGDRSEPRRDGSRGGGRGGGGGGTRYGDRDKGRGGGDAAAPVTPTPAPKPKSGIPTPVTNIPAPKGAWGTQSFAAAAALSTSTPAHTLDAAVAQQAAPAPVPEEPVVIPSVELEDEVPAEVGVNNLISSPKDTTPSGLRTPPTPMPTPAAKSTGNVWGTKGGAHLIQAEKKPIIPPSAPTTTRPPIPIAPVVPEQPEVVLAVESALLPPPPVQQQEQLPDSDQPFGVPLDSVIPSINGANINASGWEPILDNTADSMSQQQQPQQRQTIDIHPPPVAPTTAEPVLMSKPMAVTTPQQQQQQQQQKPSAAVAQQHAPTKPSSVLNMGHWETGDGDDELDFGFGSFGASENDIDATTETNTRASSSAAAPASSASSAPHASPARPPPGLSMPPMPANAILVHELENNALGPKVESNTSENKITTTMHSSSQPQLFNPMNEFVAGGQMANNPPGMYGGMGMYNIPPQGVVHSGLASMPPGQFPLDTGVNNPSNTQLNRPVNSSSQLDQAGQHHQQQVPYGMQPSSLNINSGGVASTSDTQNAGGGAANNMPSGMPSMQYPNPAYMYAAAGGIPGQFNQMGHPAYGIQAAAYGYGQQFAPQGQYGGYNQGLMGQAGGYGAPSHYDDQRGGGRGGGNVRDDHPGGGGGYNKGGGRGGYRGNRNHHQNSHGSAYANNYQANPNMGGYGGGPTYNMGYGHGGGYGNPGAPSGIDHYGMQQQQQGGGYGGFSHQDNDLKKSGVNQQGGGFQQQSHVHQQSLGLQGSSTDTNAGGASGGWPSRQQNWGGDWQQEN